MNHSYNVINNKLNIHPRQHRTIQGKVLSSEGLHLNELDEMRTKFPNKHHFDKNEVKKVKFKGFSTNVVKQKLLAAFVRNADSNYLKMNVTLKIV